MEKNVCLAAKITSSSPKVAVTAIKLFPRKEKMGPRVSKLFQIDLAFLDVRLVIDVSINIVLVSLLSVYFLFLFSVLFLGEC